MWAHRKLLKIYIHFDSEHSYTHHLIESTLYPGLYTPVLLQFKQMVDVTVDIDVLLRTYPNCAMDLSNYEQKMGLCICSTLHPLLLPFPLSFFSWLLISFIFLFPSSRLSLFPCHMKNTFFVSFYHSVTIMMWWVSQSWICSLCSQPFF